MNDEPEILQVGDLWLPGIREYRVTLEDIDSEDSDRAESGDLHRTVIRRNVYHADVVHMVRETDFQAICEAVKGDTTISVNALCPGKGDPLAEFDAYVSKLTSQLVLYRGQGGALESWWQINYSLVEV